MKSKRMQTFTLEDLKNKHIGKKGTPKRDAYETEFETFRMGALLQMARKKKGLTQEELAEKVGTTKSYISKIENNIKEVRMSTLQKIVEIGLEGRIKLSILV